MDHFLHESLSELMDLFKSSLKNVDSVIDIGTGTSIPVHFFADQYPDIEFVTVDITDLRLRKELSFIIYDGKTIPFRDQEFDVSVLNETLHHCENPETVLREASRLAETVFVVEHFVDHEVDSEKNIEEEFSSLKALNLDCDIYKPFDEESLFKLFRETGLVIKDRFEIPYHGNRKIKKYFFKLTRKISYADRVRIML